MKHKMILTMGLSIASLALLAAAGCGDETPSTETGATTSGAGGSGGEDCWWCGDGGNMMTNAGNGGATSGKAVSSSKGAGGKGSGSGGGDTPPCPDDFDPTAMCEGGPKDNYCIYMNVLYYCENGSWKAYNGGGGKDDGGK